MPSFMTLSASPCPDVAQRSDLPLTYLCSMEQELCPAWTLATRPLCLISSKGIMSLPDVNVLVAVYCDDASEHGQ